MHSKHPGQACDQVDALAERDRMRRQLDLLQEELDAVYSSKTWRIGQFYGRMTSLVRRLPAAVKRMIRRGTAGQGRTDGDFNPYDHLLLLKEISIKTIDDDFHINERIPSFSMITTVKDEAANISDFLRSIEGQTLLPQELIIVDGGSADGTAEMIEKFMEKTKLTIRLIKGNDLNIAQGRNLALREAKNEIIVCTDAGCRIDINLCKNLVMAFDLDKETDLVGGIYYPLHPSANARHFISEWWRADWDGFLPSARALAVKRSLALASGGFPEYLTLTGEDTLFDIQYRRLSKRWVFNKKAFVHWDCPKTFGEAMALCHRYGKGDGESGVGDFRVYEALRKFKRTGIPCGSPVARQTFEGYLEGRGVRSQIEIERRKIKGVVLVLSGVPFTDSGGGQRGTQLALEFIRRNYKVVYVNVYPSFEEPKKLYFDTDYSLLELYDLKDFEVGEFITRYAGALGGSLAIMEFPHPAFIPVIESLKAVQSGLTVIYDYIDNWNSTLGWIWYSPEKEQEVIGKADLLLASAKTLKENLIGKAGNRRVFTVPNAVNTHIFDPRKQYERPSDMPQTGKVVLYIGAMWGSWFDWDLLEALLKETPKHKVLLIGNAPPEKINPLKRRHRNILYLGLKQQTELPAYVRHSDVCIIPFKNDDITKYVNPLKIYEYLSMHKPVVATYTEELKEIPHIYLAGDHREFISMVNRAMEDRHSAAAEEEMDRFIGENNWKARVELLLDAVQKPDKKDEGREGNCESG